MYTLVEQKPCGENWCVIDLLFDVYICNNRCSVSHLQKQFLLFQVKKAIQSNPFTSTDRIVDAAITKSKKSTMCYQTMQLLKTFASWFSDNETVNFTFIPKVC